MAPFCVRVSIDADHLTFRLKTPWSDGTAHLLLSPLELIEKLAALCPACGGGLRLVAVLSDPATIRTYLTGAGLAAAPPASAAARSPPQRALELVV